MAKKPVTKQQDQNINTSTKEEVVEFQTACGDQFDPKAKSTCNRMCKEENPDSYALCKEHYEISKKKPAKQVKEKKIVEKAVKPAKQVKEKKVLEKKPKKTRIFDMFGDGIGTTASQINSLLICGATIEEILSEIGTDHATGTNKNRVRAHFHSLKVADMDRRIRGPQEIFLSKETKRYYLDDPTLDYYGDMSEEGCTPTKVEEKHKKKDKKKSKK